jgi:type I site-specific restriction-modification system R (restriction) subunit
MSSSKKRNIDESNEDSAAPFDSVVRGIVKSYTEVGRNDMEIIEGLRKRILTEKEFNVDRSISYFSRLVNSKNKAEQESKDKLDLIKSAMKDNNLARDLYEKVIKQQITRDIGNKTMEQLEALELCTSFIRATTKHVKQYGRIANPSIRENELAMQAFVEAKKPILGQSLDLSSQSTNESESEGSSESNPLPLAPLPPPQSHKTGGVSGFFGIN